MQKPLGMNQSGTPRVPWKRDSRSWEIDNKKEGGQGTRERSGREGDLNYTGPVSALGAWQTPARTVLPNWVTACLKFKEKLQRSEDNPSPRKRKTK